MQTLDIIRLPSSLQTLSDISFYPIHQLNHNNFDRMWFPPYHHHYNHHFPRPLTSAAQLIALVKFFDELISKNKIEFVLRIFLIIVLSVLMLFKLFINIATGSRSNSKMFNPTPYTISLLAEQYLNKFVPFESSFHWIYFASISPHESTNCGRTVDSSSLHAMLSPNPANVTNAT